MKYIFFSILFSLTISSCSTYSDEDLKFFDQEIEKYIEENSLKLEKSTSGLYYDIIEQGEGRKIQFKDQISFTYKGTLLNGQVFDDVQEPVTFNVEQLIGAWKETVLMLNEGGKAYIICPPSLGYGTHDLDAIPQNSILIFELAVADVE